MEKLDKEPGFDKEIRREEYDRKQRKNGRSNGENIPGAFRRKPVVENDRWRGNWDDDLDEVEVPNIWDN